jgi:glycosyltransferase involved in cell wall biosynthesis
VTFDMAYAGKHMPPPVVLHVPYTFFPDTSGGTEVYVCGLAQRLAVRGYLSAVAAPGTETRDYVFGGLSVHRFASDNRRRLDHAYGAPDEIAAEGFRTILHKLRPRIVHLHARTAAVSDRLIDIAHQYDSVVIFTYHTSTVSCVRGTMMAFGEEPCDGIIERRRCTACALNGLGVPKLLARLAASAPSALAGGVGALPERWERFALARVPLYLADGTARFHRFFRDVDHVVAVCQWVDDVLRRNGVPGDKITLCRQGLSQTDSIQRSSAIERRRGPLRIAYFGRIDETKGLDLLAYALKKIPKAAVHLDVFAIRRSGGLYQWLTTQAQNDPRLTIHSAVLSADVVKRMAAYDLIAIPSRWLETGPLVALEAFAAGVPVLGADQGGISELVKDGINGVLVASNDVSAWAVAIERLAQNPRLLDDMRSRITAPRTMDSVADEMAALYSTLAIPPLPIGVA